MANKLLFLDELTQTEFGKNLFEHYTIKSYIQKTILSEVILLEHTVSEEVIILKAMNAQYGCTIDLEQLIAIDHPNLSKTSFGGRSENYIYAIKSYYKGQTLKNYIQDNPSVTANTILEIMSRITEALIYLHSQSPKLILRDLKPENVVIDQFNQPIIVDLESARAYSAKQQDTVILGTPGYASPEHYGVKETDERSDVYLLGMLLHFMVTGEVWLNRQQTHLALYEHRFKGVKGVIEKAIAFDPDRRYQSAESFHKALMAWHPRDDMSGDTRVFFLRQGPIGQRWYEKASLIKRFTAVLVLFLALGMVSDHRIIGINGGVNAEVSLNQAQVKLNPIVDYKGPTREFKQAIESDSQPRELPFGLYQQPYNKEKLLTTLATKLLPEELKDVDSMGVGSGIYDIDELYDQQKLWYIKHGDYVRAYLESGSTVIKFLSVGFYYYGNYIILYSGDKVRAIVIVNVDESVQYRIYD